MVRIGVGQVLRDRWKIDALLGEGGLATVWAATHRNGDRVAIKALRADFVKNEYIRERFLREARIGNRIKHPTIVRVIDDDTLPDGTPIIVMDLLVGETLEQRRLRLGGRLTSDEVVGFLLTILESLEAAHAAGVIHRDLKPDNVFLERDGRLRILDFGIARVLEGSEFVTHTGTVVGTLEYMPPEQAAGRSRDIDARSDIYGVGAMAFKLLSGQPVHLTKNAPELMLASISRHARSVAEAAPTLPRELVKVVDRALRFEPRERWGSASEMRHALADFAPRASPRILDLARDLQGDDTTQTSDGFDEAETHRMEDKQKLVPDAPTLVTPAPFASVPPPGRSMPPPPLSSPAAIPRSMTPAPTYRLPRTTTLRGAIPIFAGALLAVLSVVAALLAMRHLL